MHLMIETTGDIAQEIKIQVSPAEWLALRAALRMLSESEEANPTDREIARKMYEKEPMFYDK